MIDVFSVALVSMSARTQLGIISIVVVIASFYYYTHAHW
jgi:hypothetical protein